MADTYWSLTFKSTPSRSSSWWTADRPLHGEAQLRMQSDSGASTAGAVDVFVSSWVVLAGKWPCEVMETALKYEWQVPSGKLT